MYLATRMTEKAIGGHMDAEAVRLGYASFADLSNKAMTQDPKALDDIHAVQAAVRAMFSTREEVEQDVLERGGSRA